MKILIVENNEPSREYLRVLLNREGYDVEVVSNGKDGLEAFKTYKPDLILSDIRVPHIDGLSLLRKIRKEKSDVFFIITTSYGSEESAVNAFKSGANDYLIKPFDSRELLLRIGKYERILKGRRVEERAAGDEICKFVKTKFLTDYNCIPAIVGKLMSQISATIDSDDKSKIEMGLNELITNSIEHGNLEITSDEKIEAYKANKFRDLCEKRMLNPKFANRIITVDFHQKEDALVWKITDQGNGFNWQELLDPTDSTRLLEPTGRGIFLTKYFFDKIKYLGKGNIVRVKKNIVK